MGVETTKVVTCLVLEILLKKTLKEEEATYDK